MKTVTYDEQAWKLVPIEPTEKMILAFWLTWKAWGGDGISNNRVCAAYQEMLSAAPTPPEVEQAQPDTIPSFDELERRYFPKERKKRLEWEAEQRALISRGSTLDAQAHPSAQDREDAERWREVAERFDQAKTSACERVLEALGLDGADAAKSLDLVIDAARAAKGGRS